MTRIRVTFTSKAAHSSSYSPSSTPPQPQWRRQGPPRDEGKNRILSALVLELHGGEELLFQFYGRQGWPTAEHVGTVSVGQAALAEKKLAKLSRTRKPTKKVKLGYKLWGTASDDEDEEEQYDEVEDVSSNGASMASRSIGSGSADASTSSNGAYTDVDGSLWEAVSPEWDGDGHYEVGDAVSRGNARFWPFRRTDFDPEEEEEEEEQAASATVFSTSNGWTVLEDSSAAVSVSADDSAAGDVNGPSEGESSEAYSETSLAEGSSKEKARLGWRHEETVPDSRGSRENSGANKAQPGTVRRRAGLVGIVAAMLASLNSAASRMAQVCIRAARQALRDIQLLWFACLHLPRAAWWAIKGRPRPPQLHASPTLARLRACKNAEQAKQFSMQAGFDGDGKTEAPLADLPRWRIEALLGTHVYDMSLYRRALTSPGAVHDVVGCSYERLEYVGDAVLGLIIRDYIYCKYPRVTEHAMCTMVSGLVSGRTVHDFARGLRLEHFLALNAAEQFSMASMAGFAGGALADAFEALLGALYLDRGYPAARAFLLRLVKELVDMERLPMNRDYKGVLGNISRLRRLGRPVYRSRARMGMPDPALSHYPLVPRAPAGAGESLIWVCEVLLGSRVVATGTDIHRTTAEQQAARGALQALGLPLEELSLIEADQITMMDVARSLPGLPGGLPLEPAGGSPRFSDSVANGGNGGGPSWGPGSNGAGKAAKRTSLKRA